MFIDAQVRDPYAISDKYTKVREESNVVVNGVTYIQKRTYQKKIYPIHRIALAIFVFLTIATVVPFLLLHKKMVSWWKQATTGVDKKIFLIGKIENLDIGTPQNRKTPPVGPYESVIIDDNGAVRSYRGSGVLFSDKNIVELMPIIKRADLGYNIYAEYTQHDKPIIQQGCLHGSTDAIVAMSVLDHGKLPDVAHLGTRNNTILMVRLLAAGLTAIKQEANTLGELKELLNSNGSAIVSVYGASNEQYIIVDDISDDLSKVRLRDPYHGWEITVTAEAFLHKLSSNSVVQISML